MADWLTGARKHLNYEDALLSHPAAIDSYELPGTFHKDPADRMLVASARELNCPLVTADDFILAYPNVLTIDARK